MNEEMIEKLREILDSLEGVYVFPDDVDEFIKIIRRSNP
jgi:hypothetical protein